MRTLSIGCAAALVATAVVTSQDLRRARPLDAGAPVRRVPVVDPPSGAAATPALAQGTTSLATAPLSKYWVRYYDGPGHGNDYGYDLAVDASGNAYVAGSATDASGTQEILLAKYGAAGQAEWAVTFPSPAGGPDYAARVVIDPVGNAIVAGDVLGAGTDYDLAIMKYAPNGVLLWSHVFNGTGNGYDGLGGGRSLAVDGAGNVFVGGYTYDAAHGLDALVLKYSANGALLWQTAYDGPEHSSDDNYGFALDSGGNLYAVAESYSSATGYDMLALKYDGTTGNQLWKVAYDGGGSDRGQAVAVDASGSVYVTGISPGAGTGYDFATMKVSRSGQMQWVQRFEGGQNHDDIPWDIAVSNTGTVVVTGISYAEFHASAATIAYDANGNLLWTGLYDASAEYYGDDENLDVDFDTDGNAWIAGLGWRGPEHGYDGYLLGYAPDGTQIFDDIHDGTAHGDEEYFGVATVGADVWVGGLSQRGERRIDTIVVKYTAQPQLEKKGGGPNLVESSPAPAPARALPRDRAAHHRVR